MTRQQVVKLSSQGNFINQYNDRSTASVFLISFRKKLQLLYVYKLRNYGVKYLLPTQFFLISGQQDITFVVL